MHYQTISLIMYLITRAAPLVIRYKLLHAVILRAAPRTPHHTMLTRRRHPPTHTPVHPGIPPRLPPAAPTVTLRACARKYAVSHHLVFTKGLSVLMPSGSDRFSRFQCSHTHLVRLGLLVQRVRAVLNKL